MENKIISLTKSRSWIGYKTNELTWTIGLTIAIILAPALLAHTSPNQLVTGTIVNALLFLAAFRLPLANAMMIAVFPSTVALLRGLLPAPMVMLIPYIIVSNIILLTSFSMLKKTPVIGVLTASFLKFGFLYSIIYIVAGQLNANLMAMFQWPQLITALIGGFVFLNLAKMFEIKN
jgi:hypothetical protein